MAEGGAGLGEAVLVECMQPKLKPPGTKRWKLNLEILLSISAFIFTLRRYTSGFPRVPKLVPAAYGTMWSVRLKLVEYCTSGERLAWAKANGCHWSVAWWAVQAETCLNQC